MHEMSVALEVCRIAEERVGRENAGRIVEVGVEVGETSGVEVENLLFWLEVLLADPPFAGARPAVQRSPGDVLRVAYLEVDDGCPAD